MRKATNVINTVRRLKEEQSSQLETSDPNLSVIQSQNNSQAMVSQQSIPT